MEIKLKPPLDCQVHIFDMLDPQKWREDFKKILKENMSYVRQQRSER